MTRPLPRPPLHLTRGNKQRRPSAWPLVIATVLAWVVVVLIAWVFVMLAG